MPPVFCCPLVSLSFSCCSFCPPNHFWRNEDLVVWWFEDDWKLKFDDADVFCCWVFPFDWSFWFAWEEIPEFCILHNTLSLSFWPWNIFFWFSLMNNRNFGWCNIFSKRWRQVQSCFVIFFVFEISWNSQPVKFWISDGFTKQIVVVFLTNPFWGQTKILVLHVYLQMLHTPLILHVYCAI